MVNFWEQASENLRKLIDGSGKKKIQISREVGISTQAMSDFYYGKTHPSLETLKKLCQVLDCDYKDILGEL